MVTFDQRPASAEVDRDAVAALGSILGVWAHPDDETFLSAGLMRLALENGQSITCVNATDGEHGTSDPVVWPPRQLGPTRRSELAESGRRLSEGLEHRIHNCWLGRPDGGLHELRPEVGAEQVGNVIDRVAPDTVITFDPSGVTGHSDHCTVSEWTAAAVRGRPGVRLLGASVSRSWADRLGAELDLTEFFYPGFPRPVPDRALALEIVCDDRLWEMKARALDAHVTQTAAAAESMGADLWRAFNDTEGFVDLSPHPGS